jgi:hypothetical protein
MTPVDCPVAGPGTHATTNRTATRRTHMACRVHCSLTRPLKYMAGKGRCSSLDPARHFWTR